MIVAGLFGLSLLLILGGFLAQDEERGTTLLMLGIVVLGFAIVIDGFERSDNFYDLYGRQAETSEVYSSNPE